jgi:hypothetical protein
LRGYLQYDWRRIGIGFDVEAEECEDAGADEGKQAEQDQRPSRQAEGEKSFEQRSLPVFFSTAARSAWIESPRHASTAVNGRRFRRGRESIN